MVSKCSLVINGKRISAAIGDTLVDAALSARVLIPHDCCTGQCDTCRVRVYAGAVDDQGTADRDTVLACQATVTGEAVIEFDQVPPVAKRAGVVTFIRDLSAEISELVIGLYEPLSYLPGQYVKLAFAGFPSRDYSPTLRVDGAAELNELVFHVRREPGGIVSSRLGDAIREGHRVRVHGPSGSKFYRRGEGRLILISTGTGFAPIWAIARAARYTEPDREMIVIAGARLASNLYMKPSLDWLIGTGVHSAVLTCSGELAGPEVRSGRPTAHLPKLFATDSIFVAGAPGMVTAVELLAEVAGATCYADPFLPAARRRQWRQRLIQIFRPQPLNAAFYE